MPANVQSMFYVGDIPWHKQGIKLEEPPNSEEAIKISGLNWEVKKVKLFSEYGTKAKNRYGIMREDNKEVLGVVGGNYIPLQNVEAFKFFDPLLENNFLQYETAGSIGQGEIIWILAKIKENPIFNVVEGDAINKYLLLSNSHDGKSAVNIKFTPIRVVCQNTLNIALNSGDTMRVLHVKNMHDKLEDVQAAITNICNVYSKLEVDFKQMANKNFSSEAGKYFNELYPVIEEKEVKTQSQWVKRCINIRAQNILMRNFETGFGVKELQISGTLWAAYNAVTEYIDHPIDYKLGDNQLLKRIWFGEGEIIKKKAYNKAMEYLKAS